MGAVKKFLGLSSTTPTVEKVDPTPTVESNLNGNTDVFTNNKKPRVASADTLKTAGTVVGNATNEGRIKTG